MSTSQGFAAGQTVGHYVLDEMISAEPFDELWLCHHQVHRSPARLRLIHGYQSHRQPVAAISALSRFEHRNLVNVLEAHATVAAPYIVYHPAAGRTMRAAMADGPMPWREAASVLLDVLAGLDCLHASGAVFGRVAPEHVVLTRAGDALLDGTGAYMLIEPRFLDIVLAQDPYFTPARGLSIQQDLWSAGVLLWALIAGHDPQAGQPLPVLSGLVAGVPAQVDEFIVRLTAQVTGDAFASAGAAIPELEGISILREQTPPPAPTPAVEPDSVADSTDPIPEPSDDPPPSAPPPPSAEAPTAVPMLTHAAPPSAATPLAAMEERLRQLMDQHAKAGRASELEPEIASLRDTLGRAHLNSMRIASQDGTLTRRNSRQTATSWVYAAVLVTGLGVVARFVVTGLEASPLPYRVQMLLGIGVFGGAAIIGLYLVIALGLLRGAVRCRFEGKDDEVICWGWEKLDVVERIQAADVRRVEVLRAADAKAPPAYRIETWGRGALDIDLRPLSRPDTRR